MAVLQLNTLADTARLGQIVAELAATRPFPPILMRGALGSGKTRLTAEIVGRLHGGANAEIASPSFTICNLYPTTPPVLHCDLYRCRTHAPDEIWDFMDEGQGLLIIEWAEYLQPAPKNYLDIFLNMKDNERLAQVLGFGPHGGKLASLVEEAWRKPAANPQA